MARAPTELVRAHEAWLQKLAERLGGDPEDLVQDTWLAALRRPPDTTRPVRPWLVRVLHNAARFRWRSNANRSARERIVADLDAVGPSSEELFVRRELQQLLVRLVGELAEPFRTTILLRFAEGLTPAEIAQHLDVPGGTVRWRLKEGLERLRCGLDAAYGGDRKRWLLLCAPFARATAAPEGAGTAGTASAFAIARWSIAALAVAGLVALAVRHSSAPGDAVRHQRHAAKARSTAAAPNAAWVAGWAAQEGAPNRHVTGRVVFAGAPVGNAQVRMTAEAVPAVEVRTDEDGRFDLGEQPPHAVAIGASAPDRLAAIRYLDLRDPTASTDIELELQTCPARIAGHVTDAIGDPIAHAQLLREDVIGTETDDNGAYTLCLLPTAPLTQELEVTLRADGYGAIVAGIAAVGSTQRDFTLVPEATITGTAVAGAEVWIEPDRDDTRPTSERGARLAVAADSDGHFRFSGASAGTYRVGAAGRGTTAVVRRVTIEAASTVDVTLAMTPAAIVHGVVTSHGNPVAGARVAVAHPSTVMRHDDPSRDPIVAGDALTQADGTFVLDGLPPGVTTLSASPMRMVRDTVVLVAGDNRLVMDTEPLGSVRGVVRHHGAPVPYARVDYRSTNTKGGLTTDANGRYEIGGLAPGRYAFYADDMRRGARVSNDGFVPGEGEVRDFDLELASGAQINGIVVDAAGAPVASVDVRFTADNDEQCRAVTDATGAFTCGMLDRGTFVPTVHAGDNGTRPFPFVGSASPVVVPDGDAVIDDVRLVVDPRTTTLGGRVVDGFGVPLSDARVRAWGSGLVHDPWSPALSTSTDAAGQFNLSSLSPGDYDVDVVTADDRQHATRVVAAGTADAVIVLSEMKCPQATTSARVKPEQPIVWDDRIELVGWDLPATAGHGTTIAIELVFRVRAPIARAWSVSAHFDGGRGHWADADHDPPCATSAWQIGETIVDRFQATVDKPGHYTLRVGFFRHEGDAPYENLILGDGSTTAGATLGTIDVD